MNVTAGIIVAATVLGAIGLWLLLPRGQARGRWIGAATAVLSLILFSSQLPRLADWMVGGSSDWGLADEIGDLVFLSLAAVTVIASVATVTLRSPVYCAIWFALSLLGTAGLFLYQGAQFLGVATIVVYAGAILVTFLFVLMLAQPEGHAFYDRISWEALLSATIGSVLVGILTMSIVQLPFEQGPAPRGLQPSAAMGQTPSREQNILAENHMAHLGAELFSRHLIAVEVAGTLLLVALVGAIAIVAHTRGGALYPQKELTRTAARNVPAQSSGDGQPAGVGGVGRSDMQKTPAEASSHA